jgi:tRNA-dihydrouridine synthase A
VHARKAWLKGLSPRKNREVPPLDYALVHRLKAAHSDLAIVLNGGIASVEQGLAEVGDLDGVMMGRAAYQEPWRLLAADPLLFGEGPQFATLKDVGLAMIPYIERQLSSGVRLHAITRHMLGLFHAVPGARAYRRHLATEAIKPGANASVLRDAFALVQEGAHHNRSRLPCTAQARAINRIFPSRSVGSDNLRRSRNVVRSLSGSDMQ